MKFILVLTIALFVLASCSKKTYVTNGETIYRTGRNLDGERLLNRRESRIKIVNSCQNCHGKNGDRMNSPVVKYSYLSDPDHFSVPYDDTLFYRFLDKDLKSDGTRANIGVIWKMSDKDKMDLLEFIKTL